LKIITFELKKFIHFKMNNILLNSKLFRIFMQTFKLCNLIVFVYPSEKFRISKFGVALSILNILLNIWYHFQVEFELFDYLASPGKLLGNLFVFFILFGAFVKIILLTIVFSTQKRFYNMLKQIEKFVLKCLEINSKITFNFYILGVIFLIDLSLICWIYGINKQTYFNILFEVPRFFYILIVFITMQCIEGIEDTLR